MNFTQLRERNHKWFLDYILISKYINKHDYFGTFRFREDQDMTWEQSQKSISHFKNVVRKKLFGRKGDFKLNFLSIIEDEKWEKNTKRYVSVKTHFHFFVSCPEQGTRLKKDFGEFLIDCWMTLQESDRREKQQVKSIYCSNKSGEDYGLKLRHSNKGIRFFDEVNSSDYSNIKDIIRNRRSSLNFEEEESLGEIEEKQTNLN
jgi:hypothetical protein